MPNTPAQIAADKAIAEHAVLRLDDFPAGYKSTPPDDSSDDLPPKALATFAACVHLPKDEVAHFLKDQPGKASAVADFEKDEGRIEQTTFESNVELDQSVQEIKGPFEILAAKGVTRCWRDLFGAAFTESTTKGETFSAVKVRSLPNPDAGDESVAFRAAVTISAGGITIPVTLDFYFVGLGRAGISLFGGGFGHPADTSLERALLQKVVNRVDAALHAA